MSNLVVVAIPDENDRVWKVSSEKIPHLTLLFLGDVNAVANLESMVEYVQHAADMSLKRFYLTVDRRDVLGADDADVLFFRTKGYDIKAIRDFRSLLLKDNNIKTAYDATSQFELPPEVGAAGQPWIPHLTLGYPTSPANKMPDGWSTNFYDVSFNKIAVWTGDFDGPEFLLKDYWDEFDVESLPMDVAMSDINANDARVVAGRLASGQNADRPEDAMAQTVELGAEFLAHYGVKGMRWGQRKTPPTPVAPTATSHVPRGAQRKTKVQVEGGENHPAHSDAIKVARAQAKLKKSGPAALSNQELQEVANRLNLERNVAQLVSSKSRVGKGRQFVRGLTGFNKEINDTANTGLQTHRLVKQFG